MLEEMISGVPRGREFYRSCCYFCDESVCVVHAPILVDFWLENFKLQVEARAGQLYLNTDGRL